MAVLGAGGNTFAAADTPIRIVHHLGTSQIALRIVTPDTAKRTALQEYHGPYTGAII
jgi:hypothetical protein